MREDFLHYLWKFKKFPQVYLQTSTGEPLEILSTGIPNENSGPDFFNAKLKIAEQLWAGNVEVHVKSSDWYLHGHEKDKNYANIILHVVWEDDSQIFRENNSPIPTLVLKDVVSTEILENYKKLFDKSQKFINCEKDIASVTDIILHNWLERLYFERLEEKSKFIFKELEDSKNDWEAVLFRLLMKNFGLKVNGEAFYSIAKAVDYSIVRKIQNHQPHLEALLFGLSGLLEDPSEDPYHAELKKEYQYLQHKFQLVDKDLVPPKFFKLRPLNFPTIRLSQLSMLYNLNQHLFSEIIATTTIEDFYQLFNIKTSPYWKEHYTFAKKGSKREKKLSEAFIQLLIINTILPIKFCYAIRTGKNADEEILHMIRNLKPEENTIMEKYKTLHINIPSAMESQALIQLYHKYCHKNRCLQCAIGNHLIKH